ncbi:MAG: Flp family type IVb pilin [Thermodesulfobacteriota bacterium]|nr:Flp family type IVb pilin [Thermodesulfobacteriota bacterium]
MQIFLFFYNILLIVRSKKFFCEETGVTAIEYALIASLIAVVIVGAVTTLGARVTVLFENVAAAFP